MGSWQRWYYLYMKSLESNFGRKKDGRETILSVAFEIRDREEENHGNKTGASCAAGRLGTVCRELSGLCLAERQRRSWNIVFRVVRVPNWAVLVAALCSSYTLLDHFVWRRGKNDSKKSGIGGCGVRVCVVRLLIVPAATVSSALQSSGPLLLAWAGGSVCSLHAASSSAACAVASSLRLFLLLSVPFLKRVKDKESTSSA